MPAIQFKEATFVTKLLKMVERIRLLLETRQLTPTQFADAIGVARPIVSHVLSGRNKPSLEVVQRILAAMPELSMPWLLNGTGDMLATPLAAGPAPAAVPAPPEVAAVRETIRESSSPSIAATPNAARIPGKFAASQVRSVAVPAVVPTPPPVPPKAQPSPVVRPAIRRFVASTPPLDTADSKPVEALPASVGTTTVSTPEPMAPNPPEPVSGPFASEASPILVPSMPGPVAASMPKAPPSLLSAENKGVFDDGNSPEGNSTAAALFAGAEKPIRRIVIFYRDGSFADYQPE
jgi:transcriptional regulator with XRE-family HTH domain